MASEKKALEGKSVVYDKCGAPAGYESDLGSRRDALLAYLTGGGQYFRVGGSGSVQGMVQCVQDLSAAQCQDCLSEAAQRLKTECATSPGGICSWEKERLVSRDGNALSSLFLPDDSQDDLFRKIEEGWGPISEEIDIRELKDEGPEVRSGDLPQPITLESGQEFTFTIRRGVGTADCVSVNYDDFVNDVEVGDMLLVDVGSCLQLTF